MNTFDEPNPPEVPKNQEWFEKIRETAVTNGGIDATQRLEVQHPEKAAMVLELLAAGLSKVQISKQTGVTRGTIRQLAWRHSDTLETKRKEFSRKYAQAAEDYSELLMMKHEQLIKDPEALKAISPDKLALTIAIMTDKAVVLAGMPGVVIEHRKGATIEDATAMIAAARARVADQLRSQAIEAEII